MDFREEIMSSSELLQAHAHLWSYSVTYLKSMALKCAIELGIPDIIHKHGQPITLSKLVPAVHIHPSKTHCLYRIMRILVHSGFFSTRKLDGIPQQQQDQEVEEEAYSLTHASRLLLSDGPAFMKMKTFFLFHLLPQAMAPWHSMSTWLQSSNVSAFEMTDGTGRTFWDCLADEPDLNNVFNEAMANDSQLIAKVALMEHKKVFEGLRSLVDVGGGTGTMAKAIASAFPHIKCTVFDLPHVVSNLEGTDNLNFVGGSVFSDAMPPADAILLKLFLHDWDDEKSLTILKRCKEAVQGNDKGGKVIVIDMVIDQKNMEKEPSEIQLCNDILMMAVAGRERTLVEWEKLFLAAGFTQYNVTPIVGSARSLIEVYP